MVVPAVTVGGSAGWGRLCGIGRCCADSDLTLVKCRRFWRRLLATEEEGLGNGGGDASMNFNVDTLAAVLLGDGGLQVLVLVLLTEPSDDSESGGCRLGLLKAKRSILEHSRASGPMILSLAYSPKVGTV
jgi:hypothetical protein